MLKELLRKEFNDARKTADATKKSAIEAVLAAILQKEKAEKGKVLSDQEVLDCITKELKVQKEIYEMYQGKDEELVFQTSQKIEILKEFLPEQLTEDVVKSMIAELDIYEDASGKTKGMIIRNLIPKIKGKFDNGLASKLVDEHLKNKQV